MGTVCLGLALPRSETEGGRLRRRPAVKDFKGLVNIILRVFEYLKCFTTVIAVEFIKYDVKGKWQFLIGFLLEFRMDLNR